MERVERLNQLLRRIWRDERGGVMNGVLNVSDGEVYDDGTESGAPVHVGDVDLGAIIHIRFEIEETSGNNIGGTCELFVDIDGGGYNRVDATSLNVRSTASAFITDGELTTDRLSTSGRAFDAGTVDEIDGSADFPRAGNLNNEQTELVYVVTCRAADLVGGEVLSFRIQESGSDVPGQSTPHVSFTTAAVASKRPPPPSLHIPDPSRILHRESGAFL